MPVQFTDESVNSYGFRVLTGGIDMREFKKSPIMLWNHNEWDAPIGKWENLRMEGDTITGEPVFDEEDALALSLKKKWEKGMLNAVSIGIKIIEKSSDPKLMLKGQTRPTVTKCVLKEVSVVNFPANGNSFKLFDESGAELVLLNASQSEHTLGEMLPIIEAEKPESKDHFNMEEIAKLLGLSAEASEEQIVGAIEALQDRASQKDVTPEFVLKYGQKMGLITDKNKEHYEKLAASDPEAVFELLATMSDGESTPKEAKEKKSTAKDGRSALVTEMLSAMKAGGNQVKDARADWSIRDWEKKDPNGLIKMKAEDKERYQTLYDATYKSVKA